MRVLVISDTHGRMENLERVLKKAGRPDMLLHLGDIEGDRNILEMMVDCPIQIVAGNNDYDWSLPREKVIEIGNERIFMTHGHAYHVALGTKGLISAALQAGATTALFGHTHKPLLDELKPVTLFNPGSLSLPRQKDKLPSYGVLETDQDGRLHASIHYLK